MRIITQSSGSGANLSAPTKNKTMQILMIAPQPYFEPRGTPISVHQRLWALSKLNHQVDLLTYHVGVDVTIPNVRIHRIPNIPIIRSVKIGPSWAKLLLDIILFFYAIYLFKKNPYEVLHTHEEASFLGVILARIFGCKHIYDMHSSLPRQLAAFNFGNYRPISYIFEKLESWVINTSDAIVTVDDSLTAHVLAINPTAQVLEIENLALQFFENSIGEITPKIQNLIKNRIPIVYTGTFERYQGLSLLISSMKKVVSHMPDVILILVGGTTRQVSRLRSEVQELELDNWVKFTGMVSPKDAIAYTEIAQVLVSPRLEGTSVPLKIYSYLQAGKPMVATNLPAHTQILNDDVALLVEPEVESLADGLLQVLLSPEYGEALGRRAYQYAKCFEKQDDYLARFATIYKKLGLKTDATDDVRPVLEI